ncbi:hypothetical protein [Granulicoccus phenolivorans]|uniref:hypothetical protein n=1 Tax=Granulicoccus phenolivorans TaxID=266854 RepID=UPI00040A9142|nr:hypothetical protein [Granulicoccus phenolivorans]
MTQFAHDNELVLPFLGLLAAHPRTLAELQVLLGPGSRYEHGGPQQGTIYSHLLTMQNAGWVQRAGQGADEQLRITEAGTAELRRRVARGITDASWTSGSGFVTALPFLPVFPAEQAADLLAERIRGLQARQEEFLQSADLGTRDDATRAKDDYLHRRSIWEMSWLEDYRQRILAGDWGPSGA